MGTLLKLFIYFVIFDAKMYINAFLLQKQQEHSSNIQLSEKDSLATNQHHLRVVRAGHEKYGMQPSILVNATNSASYESHPEKRISRNASDGKKNSSSAAQPLSNSKKSYFDAKANAQSDHIKYGTNSVLVVEDARRSKAYARLLKEKKLALNGKRKSGSAAQTKSRFAAKVMGRPRRQDDSKESIKSANSNEEQDSEKPSTPETPASPPEEGADHPADDPEPTPENPKEEEPNKVTDEPDKHSGESIASANPAEEPKDSEKGSAESIASANPAEEPEDSGKGSAESVASANPPGEPADSDKHSEESIAEPPKANSSEESVKSDKSAEQDTAGPTEEQANDASDEEPEAPPASVEEVQNEPEEEQSNNSNSDNKPGRNPIISFIRTLRAFIETLFKFYPDQACENIRRIFKFIINWVKSTIFPNS